jgi:hypothetical protein
VLRQEYQSDADTARDGKVLQKNAVLQRIVEIRWRAVRGAAAVRGG